MSKKDHDPKAFLTKNKEFIRKFSNQLFVAYFNKYPDVKDFLDSLLDLIEGDIGGVGIPLLKLLNIDPSKISNIVDIIESFKRILEEPQKFLSEKIANISNKSISNNLNSLRNISQKLQVDENITNHDLFKLMDIDGSGRINIQEFITLSRRLGIDLTPHRIKEIFTSVKLQVEAKVGAFELNEEEFILALNYLQEQTVELALETLGITREMLMYLLAWLTFLLILVLVFIIIGVQAFAIAGTFGAIINSLFPIGN